MKLRHSFIIPLILIAGCSLFQNEQQIDNEYVQALGCINSFLGCWQSRDFERGYIFLGDDLKKEKTKEEWDLSICGVSNPHHAAYEIAGYRCIGQYEYRFEVWLYDYYTDEPYKQFSRGKPDIIECKKENGYYRITRIPRL
jgi:hypothetical protein